MFEIIRAHLDREIKYWGRMSDGCGGQFKLCYCVADLMKACEKYNLSQAAFHK